MELSCAPVPTSPVLVVVDIFNVAQLVFSVDYVTPISFKGFVPLSYSLDFLWEVVFRPWVVVGILPFCVQLQL